MGRLILLAGLCLAVASLASAYNRVCYIELDSLSRPGAGAFQITDIDASLCTHLVLAYAEVAGTNVVTSNGAFFTSVTNLKNTYTNLKVLAAIGGEDFDNDIFINIASSASDLTDFSASCINFMTTKNLDGMVIDWRRPNGTAGHFQTFYERLADDFHAEVDPFLIVATVSGAWAEIDAGYNFASLNSHLDLVHVLAHDFYNVSDGRTRHPSAIRKGPLDEGVFRKAHAEFGIHYYRNKGVDAEKILLGLVGYGRTFTLHSSLHNGTGFATSGMGAAGEYTNQAGLLSCYEICSGDFTAQWSAPHLAPFANDGVQWVGYENIASIGFKTQMVVNYNFGGIAFWSLDMDDFGNMCDHGRYPLLNHVYDVLDEDTSDLHLSGDACPDINYNVFCIGKGDQGYSVSGFPRCYYNCWDDVTTLQYCPIGQQYNENDACCENDGTDNSNNCYALDDDFCEGRATGMYTLCDTDTQYYSCVSGVTYVMSCPAGTHFNGNICDW